MVGIFNFRQYLNKQRQHEFNLNNFSDEEIKTSFRFEREHLGRLARGLGIPGKVRTNTGKKTEGE